MDDFERRLRIDLAVYLDPIVDVTPPQRRRPSVRPDAALRLEAPAVEVQVIPEVVPVAAPVASAV